MRSMNPNVLSERYATPEMNEVWSELGKARMERRFWVAVLRAQRELGLEVPQEALEAYERAVDQVDLDAIKEIEARTRHDVKAKIEAFNRDAGGYQYIHLGLTSRDVTDNVEQIQIRDAMRLVHGKFVSVLRHLVERAWEYRGLELTARTHHQAAQLTLMGRRFAMWAEELLFHLEEFEAFIESYPFRGLKGAVGTQFDLANLLGSGEKAREVERRVMEAYGFSRVLDSPGQVYPRSLDYKALQHLSALASPVESFAKTMRLMAGQELVTEGFKEGQVGSSVMPHKMNTRSSERICALAELLKMYVDGASRLAGDQWEEGDVSCSALRRVVLPDAFYACDGLLETALTVLNEMGVYPAVVSTEVERYLPFLASTDFLGLAVRLGLGREEAHALIKKHAVGEALRMRQEGAQENRLVERLAQEPLFQEAGVSAEKLRELLEGRGRYLGNAENQIRAVKERAEAYIKRFPKEASYEPREIL